LINLDWAVPNFSTLSRRQKTLKVNIPYRGSAGPLHLLIDSTGIKVEGEGEWNARKHGGTKRRVWRNIHIGIDEQTLEIRAAEFTTSDVGDAPMLPELLDQIPPEQEIASATADGAFDTRKCHDAIAARGAAAIIPPRKNAKPWTPDTPGAIARNEALRASRRFGRTIWRRWSGYHRRSHSAIVGRCGSEWDTICWPENGEYASTTFFITDDPTPRLNIIRRDRLYDAFALFSDGVGDLALSVMDKRAHPGFFNPMMRPVDSSLTSGKLPELSQKLRSYLAGTSVCERTDDDKTLVLLSGV
jgi:hypothetical protein